MTDEPLYVDLKPFLDRVRAAAEAKARDTATQVSVEYREGVDSRVCVGASFHGSVKWGFGSTVSAAIDDMLRRIEPAPDLAGILGYEEVRS